MSDIAKVSVSIRVRSLNNRELKHAKETSWEIQENNIFQKNPLTQKIIPNICFSFDNIFGEDVKTNSVVFDKVAMNIIDQALKGKNGTIFGKKKEEKNLFLTE